MKNTMNIEPMVTSRRVLTWLNIYPVEENSSKWQKILYGIILSMDIFILTFFVTANAIFIYKYVTVNFEYSLFAFYLITVEISMVCTVLMAYFIRHKIKNIFTKLMRIFDECKY